MEEIQLIVKMIADLPQLALWVLVGFWAYKVVIIGSVYGVIKMAITKTYDWKTKPKVVETRLWNKTIDEQTALMLAAQISRVTNSATGYIHANDVNKLRIILDKAEQEGAI